MVFTLTKFPFVQEFFTLVQLYFKIMETSFLLLFKNIYCVVISK